MIKYAIWGCLFLASCATGTKSNSVKTKSPVAIVYPYASVYKTAGALSAYTDSTTRRP